jgi:Divergent InlB B-repeat domain
MKKLGLGLALILAMSIFSVFATAVHAANGTLVVEVHNYDDTPAFFLPGTTTVNVLTTSGTTVATQTIDSNSRATFDLSAASYYVEVYHASGLGLGINEYWGRDTSGYIVSPSMSVSYIFTRSAPVLQSLQYNISNPVVGQPVVASLTVRNVDFFSSRRCSVRLILDRDKISPYDSDQNSGQVTISPGGSYTFRLTFSTLVNDTYYADSVVTAAYGSSVSTDQIVWSNPLTVTKPILFDQNLSASTVVPGQTLAVGYYIINPSTWSVNVGLGFGIRVTSEFYDHPNDKIVSVSPGSAWYFRNFTIPTSAAAGSYDVEWRIWSGTPGTSTPIQIVGWQSGLFAVAEVASVVFSATVPGTPISGAILAVDGAQYTSLPQIFSWMVGSSHSYSWAFFLNDTISSAKGYEWQSCNGLNSSQTGTLAVPAGGGSVAASYATDYQIVFALNPSDGGSTNPNGAQWCKVGSQLSLIAQPTATYSFQNWSISSLSPISILNSTSASTTATINGAGTITANFSPLAIPEFSPWAMLLTLTTSTACLVAIMKRKRQDSLEQK